MERIRIVGLILIFAIDVIYGQSFEQRPVHTAAKIGQQARLNCTVDDGNAFLEWKNINTGDRLFDTTSGVITDNRYDVIRDETGQYDLHVLDVQGDLAVQYACQMTVDDEIAEVELVALGELSCPAEGQTVDEGDILELNCHVSYYGYKAPQLAWYDENMVALAGTQVVNGDVVMMTVNITASALQDEHIFTCQLMFGYDDGEPEDKTPPEYTDMCHTHYLVNHGVTEVMFQPDPDNYEDQVITLKVGDHINCTSSGRPEPEFDWMNEDGVEISDSYQLLITQNMLGKHTVKCQAENTFQGEEKTASREVTFEAEEQDVSSAVHFFPSMLLVVVISTILF